MLVCKENYIMPNPSKQPPKGVQQQDIWRAADAVLQAGDRPTVERIRQQMGRGSPNTIGPHLDDWFRGLSMRLNRTNRPESALPAVIEEGMQALWAKAQEMAASNALSALSKEHERLTHDQLALHAQQQDVHQRELRLIERKAGMDESQRLANAQIIQLTTQLNNAEKATEQIRQRLNQETLARNQAQFSLQEALQIQIQKDETQHEQALTLQNELRKAQDQAVSLQNSNAQLTQMTQNAADMIERLQNEIKQVQCDAQAKLSHMFKLSEPAEQRTVPVSKPQRRMRPASLGSFGVSRQSRLR